jgi:hypothetical protein
MSEQTNSTEQTAATTEAAAPEPMLNELGKVILEQIKSDAAKANAAHAKIAAQEDSAKAAFELRKTSEDAEVAKFRQWYEAANAEIEKRVAAIDDYIKANLIKSLSPEDVAAAQAEYDAAKGSYESGVNYLVSVHPDAKDEIKSWVSETVPVAGKRTRKSSGGTGEGGIKPRVKSVSVNGTVATMTVKTKDGEQDKSNFTAAALMLAGEDYAGTKVEVKDLQSAWLSAANVDDWKNAPDTVEFSFSAGDKNFTVLVTK